MATRNEYQPFDTATTNFKLWAGFIRNLLLTTCGWTATADTGQTNPTTVGTAPTNGNSVYEVYQATDALSGTFPLIVRVDYGQFDAQPSITLTMGTGSNGSGVVTNFCRLGTYRLNSAGYTTTLGSTPYNCVGSGDASGFRFIMWRDYYGAQPLQVPCFFAVERARDSSGAYIGDYSTLYAYGPATNFSSAIAPGSQMSFAQQSVLGSAGGAGNLELSWLTTQSALGSAGLGTNAGIVPCFPMPGYLGFPSMDLLCSKGADFPEGGAANSVSIYGGSHTYYSTRVGYLTALGGLIYASQVGGGIPSGQVANTQGLLFRYE